MEPTMEDVEATVRTSQQMLAQCEAVLDQVARSNVDFAKLTADFQAEMQRMNEALNSPKATAETVRQYQALIKELEEDVGNIDAFVAEAEASAPATATATESSAGKPSARRGMRI